jgi:hypothetical protein
MRDVVRGTTAAPTFFEPALLNNSDDPTDPFSLIDGSMTSINPTLCAYVEARGMDPQADDYVVVSLGTGNLTQPLRHDEVRTWGLLNWARPLTDIMFDASSTTVDYQMKRLLPRPNNETERYFRLQKRIEGVDHRMDDVSAVSLAMIREWGEELIAENDDQITRMCEVLMLAWEAKQPQSDEVEEPVRRRFVNFPSLAFWRNRSAAEDTEQVAQTG